MESTPVCPAHASWTPSAIGDGDQALDLTPESARALYFIRGRVRLKAGRRPRTLASAVTTGSWPRDRSLGAGPKMIGGCPNRARGARSRTRVNGATIPPESVAESPAKSARCRTLVVISRARASPPVTNRHERLTAPGHALGMEWHPGSGPEGQRPDAAGSRLLESPSRQWPPCGNPAHGHMREAGRSHDSARVVGPPASILDSRTGVKVNFTSAQPYPSWVRVTRRPSSTGCYRASARDHSGTRAVFDLEAAPVSAWIASGPCSG